MNAHSFVRHLYDAMDSKGGVEYGFEDEILFVKYEDGAYYEFKGPKSSLRKIWNRGPVPLFLEDTAPSMIYKSGQSSIEISQIVDSVIGKRSFGKEYNEEIRMEDDLDEFRPLKNVATDLVVKEFFATEDTLFHFLQLIVGVFEEALEKYRQKRGISDATAVFFVYKGGNILRMISNEFLLQLPNAATRELDEFYSPFFKRSDADFSIYVRPNIDDYDQVYKELTFLSYYLQVHIRDIFLKNLTKYFDYFRYSRKFQTSLMSSYLELFNTAIPDMQFTDLVFGNITLDNNRYVGKRDGAIVYLDDDYGKSERAIGRLDLSGPSFLPITYNTALDFSGSKDVRIKFALIRTKVAFNLYQNMERKMVGGELIDVSIGHRLDPSLEHFFEHVDTYTRRYTLTSSNGVSFSFLSYDITYLVDDLENILFRQNEFPWEDDKYAKRVNRLFYLYFVDIFMHLENTQKRMAILKDLHDHVFALMAQGQDATANRNTFRKKYSKLLVSALMQHLDTLMQKRPDEAKIREMTTLLKENSQVVMSAINNVQQYCEYGGKITDDAFSSPSIENLA